MADTGQQTEEPTQRRLERARKEGQFPVSREFVSAMQFIGFTAFLAAWGGQWSEGLKGILRDGLGRAFSAMEPAGLALLGRDLLVRAFLLLAPAGGLLVLLMLAMQLASTGLGVSLSKLRPDFKRLNPLGRLKEMPGQNLSTAVQAAIALPVFLTAVWVVARENLGRFFSLPLMEPARAAREVGGVVTSLLWRAAAVFLVFGAIDLFRQRRKYHRQLRMSKQEIREELKESEGSPQTKGRIRRLQREFSRRRMMRDVPSATAVVVNPTHYAVALRYSLDALAAPVVVAKGRNYLARRIRELAIANQVPIVENPALAQALYKSVEVGQEIPAHLYRAVAEILAYIFKLMRNRPAGR